MINDAQKYKKKRHPVSELYVFALFGIFAVFSLVIAVLGAKVFQKISVSNDMNNEIRSSLCYIANKVRSADQMDSVHILQTDGISVLALDGNENGYETLIYYNDGSIRELFIKKDVPFDLNAGEPIIKTNDFTIDKKGRLIFLSVTASDGKIYSMHIYLQSRQ